MYSFSIHRTSFGEITGILHRENCQRSQFLEKVIAFYVHVSAKVLNFYGKTSQIYVRHHTSDPSFTTVIQRTSCIVWEWNHDIHGQGCHYHTPKPSYHLEIQSGHMVRAFSRWNEEKMRKYSKWIKKLPLNQNKIEICILDCYFMTPPVHYETRHEPSILYIPN